MAATKYQIKQRETRDAKLIAEIKSGSPGGKKIKNPYEHGTDEFDNFNLKSGRVKVLPEKKESKKPATKKKAKKIAKKIKGNSDWPDSKITEAFPIEVCKKLVGLTNQQRIDRERRAEVKDQRKEARLEIRETQDEINTVVKDEEAEGRGKSKLAFSLPASKKIVDLQHDVDRLSSKAAALTDQISDYNDKIRTTQSEIDSTIMGQDPSGTLFEDADQSK